MRSAEDVARGSVRRQGKTMDLGGGVGGQACGMTSRQGPDEGLSLGALRTPPGRLRGAVSMEHEELHHAPDSGTC